MMISCSPDQKPFEAYRNDSGLDWVRVFAMFLILCAFHSIYENSHPQLLNTEF